MIKNGFHELCKVFDRILKKAPMPDVIANNYLHILNFYPESLAKYDESIIRKIWLSIKFELAAIKKILQSLCHSNHYSIQHHDVRSDVLFVSHIANNQQLLGENDAYFGCLPNQLSKQGLSCSIALMKHNKIKNYDLTNSLINSDIPRFLLSSSLDFLSEIRLYYRQRSFKKKFQYILKDLQIDKISSKDILRHQLSPSTIQAIRVAIQVAQIAHQTDSKFVITTYEGHAWERLVYHYVRKINPNIKCFGYQHAAVFKHQHSIKRPLGDEFDANVIFTSGLLAKNILKKSQLNVHKIVCLGSPKHLPNKIINNKKRTCLVVPRGLVLECIILFKLSLTYANNHPEQKFIWRLHPLIKFKELRKYSLIFKNLPKNIFLSEGELKDDIEKCDSVLYRGSTAVVNAINGGLKPIYYQQNSDELSIDPIYQLNRGKQIISNQKELNFALNEDINIQTKVALQDFAQKFYTPLDVEVLLNEIKGQDE